jgi:2-polyprenyl-3-methyl-5-hydroxy-6-metoxy-1,4-benzoquinol methylase
VLNDGYQVRKTYHDRVRRDVLRLVPEQTDKVLDVGGGIGANVAYLKQTGTVNFCAVADLVADECLPEVDASFAGDLDSPALLKRIGSEVGRFDAILCLDVLEHLKDPWSTIQQCHKLLNPGGVIVASIPNARNYGFVVPLLLKGRLNYEDAGILDRTHLRWFVRSTAVELMTSSGLRIEHIEGRFYGSKKRIFNAITLGLFEEFLFLQYFIRVRCDAAAVDLRGSPRLEQSWGAAWEANRAASLTPKDPLIP